MNLILFAFEWTLRAYYAATCGCECHEGGWPACGNCRGEKH
jgi:hypothetical protein